MVITGALECGSSPSNPTGAANRAKFYRRFAKRFGLDISGEKLGFKDSRPFSTGGSAGSVGLYWAPETGCTVVSWQTAFSSLVEGDYKACRQGKHLECNLSVAELLPTPPTLPTQRPTKLPTRRPTLPPTPPTLPPRDLLEGQRRDLPKDRPHTEHPKGQLGLNPLVITTAGEGFARKKQLMGEHVGRALLFAGKFNKSIVCNL